MNLPLYKQLEVAKRIRIRPEITALKQPRQHNHKLCLDVDRDDQRCDPALYIPPDAPPTALSTGGRRSQTTFVVKPSKD